MNNFIINKNFKVDNKTIELKSNLEGNILLIGAKRVFKDAYYPITIELSSNRNVSYQEEIKNKILQIYRKGKRDITRLFDSELIIFNMIKEVKTKRPSVKERVFIIGQKNSCMNSIKNTVLKFNAICDGIEIKRNIELFYNKSYEKVFNDIIENISNGFYNKFIIDITNLFLNTDYENTKRVIEYLESLDQDMLFLIPSTSCSKDRFIKIFGEQYENCVIDKDRFMYTENNLSVMDEISNILNLTY